MDDAPLPSRPAAAGGSVEPANRATVAKARFQTPAEPATERFELRDPFADVLYHATRWPDIVAKAEQLGSRRFTAIDAQGHRSTVDKVDGQWHRGPQRDAVPTRPPPLATTRDEIPDLVAAAEARERGRAAPQQGNTPDPSPSPTAEAPSGSRPSNPLPRIDADADRSVRLAQLEAALKDRYVIKRAPMTLGDVTVGRTEYRFRGDTTRVAFTESTFKLSTDTNSPSVARSMIDVAEARNWRALRVSGNEEFKRLVWLEASVRGVKALGYEPTKADLDVLAKERSARQRNHIEAAPQTAAQPGTTPDAQKGNSGRGGGGRKAVLAAIDAILVAKNVPEARREAVLAAATEQLAQRTRAGPAPKVAVYDREAPSQRPVVAPPERSRGRDRTSPAR
ncbi:LPD7 domain-containing protein [Aquincola tertiaricarbonis]|uniref:LPD7 domain-containing protein n=1 Tax=Aquincola tertiaricarbonis TaxID=391953 RepID=UPI00061524B7|nr:LPD7 domain-containing protein [Aquincola tertiaricarbonis]